MTTIVQITPEIGPGTGVGGVAHHLEQEWRRAGLEVKRFTLDEAGGAWLPIPSGGFTGRFALIARVVWFSTVGTYRARAYLRRHPAELSICHNDALAGDVYVNHGIVQAAMRARGHYWLRMVRNPLHLFTSARDRKRYASRGAHRVVVNLVTAEDRLLRETFPRLAIATTVIGNGVDVERFRPPAAEQRSASRAALGLAEGERGVLFIGNEFGRKGLRPLIEAMGRLEGHVHLFVVGGSAEMIAAERTLPAAQMLGPRLHFAGAHADPRPWLRAADALASPSLYESYGLVVLEALASGLPVVATATGCVPDVIEDGINGVVVQADPDSIARGLRRLLEGDVEAMRRAARATAEAHSWPQVADRYLELLRRTHEPSSADVGLRQADS